MIIVWATGTEWLAICQQSSGIIRHGDAETGSWSPLTCSCPASLWHSGVAYSTPLSASGITPIKNCKDQPSDVNTLVFVPRVDPISTHLDFKTFSAPKCLQLSNLGSTLLCNIGMCVFLRTASAFLLTVSLKSLTFSTIPSS